MATPPDGMFPLTQETALAASDFVYAPWIKEMGFADVIVREGFVSMRMPAREELKFFSGAICGQALMAATTSPHPSEGTVYQHTHFLRPAVSDDFLTEATVKRFGKASAMSTAPSQARPRAILSPTGCLNLHSSRPA